MLFDSSVFSTILLNYTKINKSYKNQIKHISWDFCDLKQPNTQLFQNLLSLLSFLPFSPALWISFPFCKDWFRKKKKKRRGKWIHSLESDNCSSLYSFPKHTMLKHKSHFKRLLCIHIFSIYVFIYSTETITKPLLSPMSLPKIIQYFCPHWILHFLTGCVHSQSLSALGLQSQKSCLVSGTSSKEVPEPAQEEREIKNERGKR